MKFNKPDKEVIRDLLLEQMEIDQLLGRALHYPPYPEDFETDQVCTGEHTVVTLAMEAAAKIAELEAEINDLKRKTK